LILRYPASFRPGIVPVTQRIRTDMLAVTLYNLSYRLGNKQIVNKIERKRFRDLTL